MKNVYFQGRRAVQIENDFVRLTAIVEGGHIAEITHKVTGVNPLWVPPWPSVEPSQYSASTHPEYGVYSEGKLLSGILGHNVCLDMFGPPSEQEAAAGMSLHGEANVVPWSMMPLGNGFASSCILPSAQLRFQRDVQLNGCEILFSEILENLSGLDRPIAWAEHVTLGPPFLERGVTQFKASATRSRIAGTTCDFDWPLVPRAGGRYENLETYTDAESSGGFTTQLMDPEQELAFFLAYSPRTEVFISYAWSRRDFPWLGIWEENHSRKNVPWNGHTMTRGMEFSVSPFAETRKEMIERNHLFETPCYKWIPAKSRLQVRFGAVIGTAKTIPNGPRELVSFNK